MKSKTAWEIGRWERAINTDRKAGVASCGRWHIRQVKDTRALNDHKALRAHPQAWVGVRLPWSCASSRPLFCLFYNLTNGFVYEMVKLCRTRNQLCYQWCVNIKLGIQLMLWNPIQDLTPRRTQFPKWDVWSETTSEKSLFY